MSGVISKAIAAAESEPLQSGQGVLSYPDRSGDVKQTWNRDNPDEVEAARIMFERLTRKGYRAFRLDDDGERGSQMNTFNSAAGRIVLIPPVVGG